MAYKKNIYTEIVMPVK